MTVTGDIPEKAINKPMTAEGLEMRLSKLGGTQFYANNVHIELDDGLILPVSKLNEMRRTAVEELNKTDKGQIEVKPFIIEHGEVKSSGAPYATACFKSAEQIPDRHPFKRVFITLDSPIEDFIDNRAGAVIPRGLFGIEQEVAKRLERLKKAGIRKILCGNIGAYRLARDMGFEVFGDFGLNVFNSISAKQIKSPILSFELRLEQANAINAQDTGLIVYGKMPLMLTRNCPVKNDIGCYNCNLQGKLTDRKGYEFPVICSDYPCVEVLNPHPIYMLDRLNEIKTDFVHFYFSTESVKQVESVVELYEKGGKPDFKYTRGLYQRGAI